MILVRFSHRLLSNQIANDASASVKNNIYGEKSANVVFPTAA
jgi:hypothetical protein